MGQHPSHRVRRCLANGMLATGVKARFSESVLPPPRDPSEHGCERKGQAPDSLTPKPMALFRTATAGRGRAGRGHTCDRHIQAQEPGQTAVRVAAMRFGQCRPNPPGLG